MVKVGHAFSDFVIEEKTSLKRRSGSGISRDFRSFIPLFILVIVISILGIRLFYLQVLRGEYYRSLARDNRTKTTLLAAPRGIIFDRSGKPLVRNSPAFKVVDKSKPVGQEIVWIEKDEALAKISKGEKVENDVRREYLFKEGFAHVVGYTGQVSEEDLKLPQFEEYGISDFTGKLGLEKQYERLLHGKNGKELYEVDANGQAIRFLGRQEAEAGGDLATTLDADLQAAVMDAFGDVKKGAVVVSDPRNGGILSLYSKPSFDPNLFTFHENYKASGQFSSVEQILTDTQNQPFLDRAISGVYPPGSTFKLITAIAALQKGAIKPDTKIEDTGILKIGAFSFGNWYFLQYGGKDGDVDVVKGVARSNDIFFYKAAEATGVNTMSLWAQKFGLGERLGIDLPGEATGTVPSTEWKEKVIGEQWYLGDTYHLGIGQGYLLSTPLQVNFWTIPFANDGVLFKPHLIQGETQILRKEFMKKQYRDLVRTGMKQSCEPKGVAYPFFEFKVKNEKLKIDGKDFIDAASGSAKMIRIPVGCKTGTAETTPDKKPHAWITVFAPFHNPEIVVTVLAENAGEGSSVAAPIAKKILEKYFEKK